MKRAMSWFGGMLAGGLIVLAVAAQLGMIENPIVAAQSTNEDTAAPDTAVAATGLGSLPAQSARVVIADGRLVPAQHAHVGPTAGGVVTALLVEEGDVVAENQLLLQLDDQDAIVAVQQAEADLMGAQARYDELVAGALPEDIAAAEASLAAATARLQRLQLSTDNGDIGASEAMLRQAQAELQSVVDGASADRLIEARANVQNAEAELRRAQRAYNDVAWRSDVGATPESAQLETATNNYEAATARLADLESGATRAEIGRAQAQVSQAEAQLSALQSSRPADIAAYSAEVSNAQAQLDKLLAGTRPEQLAQAEADVAAATARLQQQLVSLSKLQLRAPFAGTIATLDVDLGEQAGQDAPVVRLADLGDLRVETEDLTELQVVDIQEGDRATVTFDALPELTTTGTVESIRPYGESSAGDIVYRVVLSLPEQDERLRWNMTAVVTFD